MYELYCGRLLHLIRGLEAYPLLNSWKDLSVAEAENLLSVAEPYIDFIKLGFGTALFTRNLETKVNGLPQ